MATEAATDKVIHKYSRIGQAQDHNPSEIRVGFEDLERSKNTELSDLWNLVSGLVTAHPSAKPPLWEEVDSSPLQVIQEETASECAQFSRSSAPSPLGRCPLKVEISPPTEQQQVIDFPQSSWSDRSEFISSTLWSERSEFMSSTRTSIESPKSNTSMPNIESITLSSSFHYAEKPPKETWIMSNSWLSVSDASDTLFTNAETLFGDEQYQSGLAQTDIALRSAHVFGIPDESMEIDSPLPSSLILHGCFAKPSTIITARTINLQLMKSCALLASECPDRALESADLALGMAEKKKIYYMVSKSQLYRGLALMSLQRWRDASLAFTRAANVRGWAVRVPALKKEADRRLQEALTKIGEKC